MLAVAVLLPLAILAVIMALTGGPVARRRLARFARRQQLEITPGNGNQVVAYLATTRRWRTAGALVAVAGYVWVTAVLLESEWSVGVLQVLAGWFVGALVAEARLARRPTGQRRAALLRPRDPAAYLSRPARLVLPAALLVSLTVGALGLVTARSHLGLPEGAGRTAVLAQFAALAVAVVVWTVQRRVLVRPQPADLAPDQQAADDAIRSRSLHALAGAGTALVLYAVIHQLAALYHLFPHVDLEAAVIMLALGAPVLGWLVATARWSVRRPLTNAARTA